MTPTAASRNLDDARTGGTDVRAATRLTIDAVLGVTDIVESMHATIAAVAPPFGKAAIKRTRGLTAQVYRSIRTVTRGVGFGLDFVQRALPDLDLDDESSALRVGLIAKLNGVLGDRLEASGSPLAIPMSLRSEGRVLELNAAVLARQLSGQHKRRVVVLVHGLCMHHGQWQRETHDHGRALASDLDCSVLHLHYNTGRRISTNGEEFARKLDALLKAWPEPIDSLILLGHSMGGLVIRSALEQARQDELDWLDRVDGAIFLGSPHHGAPLERLGNGLDRLLELSPYSAPFTQLGRLRSAGIRDLRYGNVTLADWQGVDHGHWRDSRRPTPLPEGLRCLSIAATRSPNPDAPIGSLKGDGLVPVASALGRHDDADQELALSSADRFIVADTHHLGLLEHPEVYTRLRDWLLEGSS
ncbi:lipase family alpha/beta hydrolase [Wenzhouxiangella marina]|nr:alpha/beta hydrolase [Wenzhouxiangella marina]MBB6088003.1 pimeloyl-ACP methyl ester carboxylesterase [Wenzhouxiangella marina]